MTDRLPAIGVHPIATDQSMPVLELAREAEDRRLRSLYLPEHTHIPVGSEELPNGYRLDEGYRRTLDPFVACAYIAAVTSLEVGTGVALVAQHDAIALAKAIATLDYLTAGRVVIGVGFGSNAAEASDHGLAGSGRAPVVEETVRLMKAVWTEEEAVFEGTYRRISRSWSWPKPVTAGGPPVLLGARASARTFDRIIRWADGWLPVGVNAGDPSFAASLADLRARWTDSGRAGEPSVCYFFYPGAEEQMRRQIEYGTERGIQRMQVSIGGRSRDEALPILDHLASAFAAVSGS
jgi:probable F420-dependent oxidoreductase